MNCDILQFVPETENAGVAAEKTGGTSVFTTRSALRRDHYTRALAKNHNYFWSLANDEAWLNVRIYVNMGLSCKSQAHCLTTENGAGAVLLDPVFIWSFQAALLPDLLQKGPKDFHDFLIVVLNNALIDNVLFFHISSTTHKSRAIYPR